MLIPPTEGIARFQSRCDDADGIRAVYRDGMLVLSIPRAERDKRRTIQIS